MTGDVAPVVELQLFACKEAYVYKPPPATTVGHRAELWNVNKWLQEVSVRVVSQDEACFIRLADQKTGELFAECPVPTDAPLITAVEPVIDSSRYFVLRIVDSESGRHAFIGVGFREREEASDFNAALYDHLQYVRRKHQAAAARDDYEQRAAAAAAAQGEGNSREPAPPAADLSLKQGEKLKLSINMANRAGGGASFVSGRVGRLTKRFSFILDGSGGSVAAMSPSASASGSFSGSSADDMAVSPAHSAGSSGDESGGHQGPQRRGWPAPRSASGSPVARPGGGAGQAAGGADWGDFVG